MISIRDLFAECAFGLEEFVTFLGELLETKQEPAWESKQQVLRNE